ncbi:hypothetical protein PQR71_09175 [Paraburkholderia fungorum]|uniref:hypothetical protein n=1 Tax=Paraburkholderia fungorum TaxID=134537 RepID=UPI0038B8AD2F
MINNDAHLGSVKIGFIGAGRLGRALAWCFEAHGCSIFAAAKMPAVTFSGVHY